MRGVGGSLMELLKTAYLTKAYDSGEAANSSIAACTHRVITIAYGEITSDKRVGK